MKTVTMETHDATSNEIPEWNNLKGETLLQLKEPKSPVKWTFIFTISALHDLPFISQLRLTSTTLVDDTKVPVPH